MGVSFGSIKIGETAKKHMHDVLESNKISTGVKVELFESEWGKLFDYKYNLAVSSGTDADIAACMTLYDFGAERDDEIIAPALGFIAVGNSIAAAGFKPVFVDVELESMNIDPEQIEKAITKKTKAIMAVHTMGVPCKMDRIIEIAKKHNLIVIEDACEAHGAKYKGKYVGHWGDITTFSFYAAHLICSGEGGMVSTNNEKIAKVLESVRNHGREGEFQLDKKYFNHVRPGLNLRMNEMEASIGLEGIEKFWETFNKRKDNLNYLLEQIGHLKKFAYFNKEDDLNKNVSSPHALSILLKKPKYRYDELYKFLRENQITCKRNFGSIPTQHKAFSYLGYSLGDFPNAEYIGNNGLHFGIHQYLEKEELDFAAEKLFEYFKQFKEFEEEAVA